MRKALRYNELDELAWEAKHGCVEHPDDFDYDPNYVNYSDPEDCGDVCWDQICEKMAHNEAELEDDETGPGIFGNELNHEQNANGGGNPCISNGKLFGHGEKDEIIRMIFDNLVPFKDYHFEFGFFEAK